MIYIIYDDLVDAVRDAMEGLSLPSLIVTKVTIIPSDHSQLLSAEKMQLRSTCPRKYL